MHLSRYNICTCLGAYQFWGVVGEVDESAFDTSTLRPTGMGTGTWSADAGYTQLKYISQPFIQAELVIDMYSPQVRHRTGVTAQNLREGPRSRAMGLVMW